MTTAFQLCYLFFLENFTIMKAIKFIIEAMITIVPGPGIIINRIPTANSTIAETSNNFIILLHPFS